VGCEAGAQDARASRGRNYAESHDMVSLRHVYETLLTGYRDGVEKYSTPNGKRFRLLNMPYYYAGQLDVILRKYAWCYSTILQSVMLRVPSLSKFTPTLTTGLPCMRNLSP